MMNECAKVHENGSTTSHCRMPAALVIESWRRCERPRIAVEALFMSGSGSGRLYSRSMGAGGVGVPATVGLVLIAAPAPALSAAILRLEPLHINTDALEETIVRCP